MPIRLPNDLPAADVLKQENVFVMSNQEAEHQDIRPLRVLLLNLILIPVLTGFGAMVMSNILKLLQYY